MLVETVLSKNTTCIFVPTYVEFHEMHRLSEFEENSSYLTLFLIYNYISSFDKLPKSRIDRLVDSRPRILVIVDGKADNYPPCVDCVDVGELSYDISETLKKLYQYHLVINCSNHEIREFKKKHPVVEIEKVLLEKAREEGVRFISIKSDRVVDKYKNSSVFDQLFTKRYLEVPKELNDNYATSFGEILIETIDKNKAFSIPYGPWPLYHIDFSWKSFPEWPKLDDLKKRPPIVALDNKKA